MNPSEKANRQVMHICNSFPYKKHARYKAIRRHGLELGAMRHATRV